MAEGHLDSKIKEIDHTQKPLVVLLKGPGSDSAMLETIVRTSGLATLREQTTLFALHVSEAEAMHLQPVTDALRKASLPSVGETDLPMVLVIGAEGKALKVLRGLVTAGEVRQCLTDGVAAFQLQLSNSTASEAKHIKPEELPTSPTQASTDDTESLLLQTPAIPSISRGDTTTAAQTEPPPASARRLSDSEQEQDLSAPLQLQIYLPDGEAVRATFTGSTLLQEVCSYLEQHGQERISGNYKLVSHHLRHEFDQGDMSKSLHELGVVSMTSLRLLDVYTGGSAHGRTSALSGLGVVSNLLQSVRRLLLGIMAQLGFRRRRVSRSRQESNDDASADQEAQGLNQDIRTSDSVSNQQQSTSQSLRKRTAGPGKVHGIHDSNEDKSNKEPDGNSYWNGNSTQFDGDE